MSQNSSNRVPLIGAVAAAIVVAVVLALLLAGGDDDNPTVSRPSATRSAPAPVPAPPVNQQTETSTGPKPSDRDAGAIQQTVTDLVSANERGDAQGVCRIVGQPAGGTGFDALHTCARNAGVDVSVLPISDELSIDRIRVVKGRGTAQLAGGVTISLRRVGSEWRVTAAKR
jgi:hypothetical protein